MRPLTGRELSQQHKALCDAGVSATERLRWLCREVGVWEEDMSEAKGPGMQITYGGGRCAACGCKTRAGNLMCSRDWGQVPHELRAEVYRCLRLWNVNEISLDELRTAQAAAVEAVTGKPQVPTLQGSEDA